MTKPRGFDEILARFPDAKQNGDNWVASCPCGGHGTPEKHLNLKDLGAKVLVTCHGGRHSYQEICQALGYDSLNYNGATAKAEIVATYDYKDAQDVLIYQVVRFDPKDFRQRRPDGAGGWVWNIKGITPILYHLSEVIEAVWSGQTVYLCEGEKDADNLATLGVVASTNSGGAEKWRPEYCATLAGASIVILPDQDEPGQRHAVKVAASLHGSVMSLKVVNLPGREGYQTKDVSNWLAVGGTLSELECLVKETVEWDSSQKERRGEDVTPMAGAGILTDTTNAELIAALFGDRLRFDIDRERWLIWATHYWEEAHNIEVIPMAIEAARTRYKQSVDISDLKERQRSANWAIQSEQRSRIESAIALAKAIEPVADKGGNWDSNPWLFALTEGVIDLQDMRFRPGRQKDRVTLHSGVEFDNTTRCPRWLQFLDEVFNNDTELIDWIQRAAGYCLTGNTGEQCVFLCYGKGANGKSVFLSTLRRVMGQYAYDAPFATFELNSKASIPNDLAALERRRFITSSETNEGTRLNEARIKALTGGDPCTARFLHHEFFTFQPACKIWLAVNHKPRVADDSHGFWRRVRLIPFERQFSGDEADKSLGEKLRAEDPGILNWLIQGCRRWMKQGLDEVPSAVTCATQEYQTESDPLAQFIEERCVVVPDAEIQSSVLYKAYISWAEEQGMKEKEKMSSTAFGRKMGMKYVKVSTKKGKFYQGLGVTVTGF